MKGIFDKSSIGNQKSNSTDEKKSIKNWERKFLKMYYYLQS